MDMRTRKVFDSTGRELPPDEAAKVKKTVVKISGENCTDYCVLAFKRNCFTVAKAGRNKCTRFRLQCLAYHKRKAFC